MFFSGYSILSKQTRKAKKRKRQKAQSEQEFEYEMAGCDSCAKYALLICNFIFWVSYSICVVLKLRGNPRLLITKNKILIKTRCGEVFISDTSTADCTCYFLEKKATYSEVIRQAGKSATLPRSLIG